jgi:hypothetical protein
MKRRILILLFALHAALLSTAQTNDTTSIWHAFKKGHVDVNARYFFMATQNEKSLTDYFANALGISLHYQTAKFHGFQFGIGSSAAFNIGSSNLKKTDPVTGLSNRYETALFDVEDASKKIIVPALQQLYLKYNYKKSTVVLGRQLINTPFINEQDSRMLPNAVQGIWLTFNEIKKVTVQAGWLNAIESRATVKWKSPGSSIGILSTGVNSDGIKSDYKNNIKSNSIALLGFTIKPLKSIKLQLWDTYAENTFNTAMLQTDIALPIKQGKFLFAVQMIRQDAINDGGNKDQSKTYFLKNHHALSFGSSIGWQKNKWLLTGNFNRITASGRFLFPREWGREPLFTYLSRERNEGLGNVNAFTAKIDYSIRKEIFIASVAFGNYSLPDVKNYALNKYSLPSYAQINGDIKYVFKNRFKGLDAQVLIVAKLNKGNTYNNKKYTFDKVNLANYNFILNYHFK